MKMRTPHIVPLPKQTLEQLESLRTLTGESEWLSLGRPQAKKPMSNNTILKGLERMGYKGRMTGSASGDSLPQSSTNEGVPTNISNCNLPTLRAKP